MLILHLTLKKKWFDMILSGEKKEEYRDIKPYWRKRLLGKNFDAVRFINGYSKKSPTFLIKFNGLKLGMGRLEWGAPGSRLVFIIKLGDIIKLG